MDEMKRTEPLSVGGWIGTLILLSIPIVNIIMVFVWAFGKGNISRKNYAIAVLILFLIMVVIYIICVLFFGVTFASMRFFDNIKDIYPMM